MCKKSLFVQIETSSGFCFGVVNAIKLAEENLIKNEKLYCIGQIVHNEKEVERLEKKGLVTIAQENIPEINDCTILVRAHGEPPESFEEAKKHNNKVINATCPIVLKLQKRIKESFNNGENILIFGKPEHPEVIGLNGQTGNKALIFSHPAELQLDTLPQEITLYSQTTMSLDKFRQAVSILQESDKKLTVHDTICRQVSGREEKLTEFCQNFDKIVFVAGRNSSNGKVLFKICQTINSNSYFISSVDEINTNWFATSDKVGVCGATSTPKWQLENVKNYLEQL